MSDTYQYALLTADPTTSTRIMWIDDSGDGGGSQSLEYGASLENSVADSSPSEIPDSNPSAYLYDVLVTGLTPDSSYSARINSADTIDTEIRTLPETLKKRDTLRIGLTSDHHPWRGDGMVDVAGGPKPMENMGQMDHDIILFAGDFVTNASHPTESDTDNWLTWWEEYANPWFSDHLVPVFAVPGNHELSNNAGVAPGVDDPNDPGSGYFQLFFPNTKEMGPTEENYASVTVGDYVQFIGLDNHSAWPEDQANWMENTIDDSIPCVIPFQHVAVLPGSNRSSSDEDVQKHLMDEWVPIYYDTDSIRFWLCGNEHTRKETYPMVLADEKPEENYFEVDDGRYFTADEDADKDDSIREFGDGWMNNYDGVPPIGDWFIKTVDNEPGWNEQYYYIGLTNPAVTINQYNEDGKLIESVEFSTMGEKVATIGDVRLGDVTMGD